jgi:hypothetical protein
VIVLMCNIFLGWITLHSKKIMLAGAMMFAAVICFARRQDPVMEFAAGTVSSLVFFVGFIALYIKRGWSFFGFMASQSRRD